MGTPSECLLWFIRIVLSPVQLFMMIAFISIYHTSFPIHRTFAVSLLVCLNIKIKIANVLC
jgi:hypothetical protein